MKKITKSEREELRQLIANGNDNIAIQKLMDGALAGIHPKTVGMASTFKIILDDHKTHERAHQRGRVLSHNEYERNHKKLYGESGLEGAVMNLIKFIDSITEA